MIQFTRFLILWGGGRLDLLDAMMGIVIQRLGMDMDIVIETMPNVGRMIDVKTSKMHKKILILTDKSDVHPTSVIQLLNERNIPFFRLNTEVLLTDYDFAWMHCCDCEPKFYVKDRTNGKVFTNEDIWSVWYRKPDYPKYLPFDGPEDINRHNLVEGKQFFIYLMHYLSECYSIGNHFYDKRANSKMLQSKIAVELGMKISPTCISNVKRDIINFTKDYDYIALKCLRDHWVKAENGLVYDLSTQKIDRKMLNSQPNEAFSQSVVFAQQYIEKQYELRVTVMGPHVFTCKLDSQAQTTLTGAIDWRQGYDYDLKHEIIDTPKNIQEFCRKYLRKFNLNFGCFDFIYTPNDEYVFLECNPNGQWGWIEDLCHAPMSEAMVDCLVNKLPV